MNTNIHDRIALLGTLLTQQGLTLGTAESCTGGLIAAMLTDISGSSAWFAGGVVSYANSVKTNVLGVPESTLAACGAVSGETVTAMVKGACTLLGVECAVAVSGIAGPTGGTPDKPVGTVWMATAVGDTLQVHCHLFTGSRESVRLQTVRAAVETLITLLNAKKG